jgi:hypothetical protein
MGADFSTIGGTWPRELSALPCARPTVATCARAASTANRQILALGELRAPARSLARRAKNEFAARSEYLRGVGAGAFVEQYVRESVPIRQTHQRECAPGRWPRLGLNRRERRERRRICGVRFARAGSTWRRHMETAAEPCMTRLHRRHSARINPLHSLRPLRLCGSNENEGRSQCARECAPFRGRMRNGEQHDLRSSKRAHTEIVSARAGAVLRRSRRQRCYQKDRADFSRNSSRARPMRLRYDEAKP